MPAKFYPFITLFSFVLLMSNSSFSQPGKLNLAFGTQGIIKERFRTNSNALNEAAAGIVTQTDGRTVVSILANSRVLLARLNWDGSIDASFGNNGFSDDSKLFGNGLLASAKDGSLYVSGAAFMLAHYSAEGTLDKSFGNNGITSPLFSDKVTSTPALIVKEDGKILLGGSIWNGVNYDMILVQYNENGTLDENFGGSGISILDFDSQEGIHALAIQPDNKIIASGYIAANNSNQIATVRINSDGSLDETFGQFGRVIFPFNIPQNAVAVKLQSDGKIVVAGGARDFIIIRYNEDGSPDITFGINGAQVKRVNNLPVQQFPRSMDIFPDGRILIAGDVFTSGLRRDCGLICINTDGSLDGGFGNGGQVLVSLGAAYNSLRFIKAQPNGKVKIVGSIQTSVVPVTDYAIAQLDAVGNLDKSFGGSGQVYGFIEGELAEFRAMGVQHDGKIVAVGTSVSNNDPDFIMARYFNDGTPDPSFGQGGKLINNFGIGEVFSAMAVLPNGKFLSAGSIRPSNGTMDYIFAMHNPDGSLDAGFGQNGRVISSLTTNNEELFSMIVQPDNKFLVGGANSGLGGQNSLLARYLPDGSLDLSFGKGGTIITNFGYFGSVLVSIKLQKDGKIVTLSRGILAAGKGVDIVLSRYNMDGTPDISFGNSGTIISNLGVNDNGQSIEIDAEGKILIGGSIDITGTNYDYALMRFNPDGSLDQLFGNGGISILISPGSEIGQSVSLQPDGKIILVGQSNSVYGSNLNILRFNPKGEPDQTFGLNGIMKYDIDGDEGFNRSMIVADNLYVSGMIRQMSNYASIAAFELKESIELNCPVDVITITEPGLCSAIVTGIDPSITPSNGVAPTIFNLIGSTYLSGEGTASGIRFNRGYTQVSYSLANDPIKTCSFNIIVNDTEAPKITGLMASPAILWPANHKMRDIELKYVLSDNCEVVNSSISVTSNEPSLNAGSVDWEILDANHIRLRAERYSKGNGRIYSITIKAVDTTGNETVQTLHVTVPKNPLDQFSKDDNEHPGQQNGLKIKVNNNPSRTNFNLEIQGLQAGQKSVLRVINTMGTIVETRENLVPNQRLQIGEQYRQGVYLIEILQGDQRAQILVIKF